MTLWKVYLAILLVTATEGGMNTIYPLFLEQLRFAVDPIGLIIALFGVTQFAARIPIGALYDGGRAKSLFVAFAALYTLCTVGFAYNGGTIYLLALTLLHGFTFGAIGTVMLAWTRTRHARHRSGVRAVQRGAGYRIVRGTAHRRLCRVAYRPADDISHHAARDAYGLFCARGVVRAQPDDSTAAGRARACMNVTVSPQLS